MVTVERSAGDTVSKSAMFEAYMRASICDQITLICGKEDPRCLLNESNMIGSRASLFEAATIKLSCTVRTIMFAKVHWRIMDSHTRESWFWYSKARQEKNASLIRRCFDATALIKALKSESVLA